MFFNDNDDVGEMISDRGCALEARIVELTYGGDPSWAMGEELPKNRLVECKHCKQTGLIWGECDGKWRLTGEGSPHCCSEYWDE